MTKKKNLVRVGALLVCLLIAAVLYFTRYSPNARREMHLARGEEYFQSGDYDRAKLEYMVVARTDASNQTAIERLGNIWLLQGAPAQALPYLVRAKQVAPNEPSHRRKIIGALIELGDLASARKEVDEFLLRAPDDDEGLISLAMTANAKEAEELQRRFEGLGKDRLAVRFALGIVALKKRDFDSAERELGEVLAKDERFYRAHMAMADVHMFRRNSDLVGQSLKAGSSFAPVRTRERIRYADYRALTGDTAEAKTALASVTAEASDYIPALVLAAKIAFAQKEFPEVQATLEKVFNRDPGNFDARLLEGELHIAKSDIKAAIESLERLTKVYPNAASAKYQLGRALALGNRQADAVEVLRQAVAIHPNSVEAHTLLAEIYLRTGQPQAVVDNLGPLAERHSNLGRTELLLADAYRILKRYDQAIGIYRRHTELAPKSPLPWIFLGTTYREKGSDAEAMAAFDKALAIAPNHVAVVTQLVELDLKRKDFNSAAARLTKLDEKTAASAGAKILSARIQGAQQQWPQAEESLIAAISADPDQSAAYQYLISLYYEKGRLDEALKRLEEKLARTPDDLGSRLTLARIHEEQKNYEGARLAYEAALKSRPESIVALNNLAYLYAERLGQLPKALELARKAHSLQPADPSVADTLGWVLYQTGDFEGAAVLLRESSNKLAERGEVPGEVYFHLGMTLAALGQFDGAVSALNKAQAAARDFEGKSKIPMRLALLNYSRVQPGEYTLERLRELATKEPSDPLIQLRLGEALETAGKAAEAGSAYERALQLSPKLATAAANLARLHVAAIPDPAKARALAKIARALAPSDPVIAASLGVTASQLGDHAWAYSLLQQAGAQGNPRSETLFELARVAYFLGKVKEAGASFERILPGNQQDPIVDRAKAHIRLLQIIDQRSADPKAQQDVDAALMADPGNLLARMAAAMLLERNNNWEAAAKIYREILKAHPAFPLAQARLATVQVRSGNWAEAHELATAARKSMPDDALTALVLGETSFRNKDYRRSADYLSEAARSEPLDGKRLFLMGAAYFELKDRPRSEQFLKQALESGLTGEERGEAERMLKLLQG